MERDPSPLDATPAPTALFAWGANSYGQLGLGHKEDVLLPQQLNDFCKPVCVRRITGGGGHSAVVTDEGSLFVCGLNKDGQLGLGHTEDVLCFTPCKSLLRCPIQQVACGWDFTIILTESGQVLSCGSNSFGQLGIPHGPRRCLVPQAIELLREKVVSVAAGLRHALAATGLENSKAIRVAAGSEHSASLTDLSSGVVRYVTVGTAAEFNFATVYDPHVEGSLCLQKDGLDLLRRASSFQLVKLRLGEEAIVQDAGELYVWGSGKHGQLASQAAFLPVPQEIEAHCFQSEKVTAVWSGWTHLVAQTETGKVFTWGRADYGQLGRKPESPEGWKPERQGSPLCCSRPQKSTPSSLHCLTGATEVSCGSEHNLAVVGGVCRSWGWNEHGMCGDGSEAHVWAPKPVQALRSSSVLLVGCGAGHSLALCQLPALPPPGASEDAGSQEATERRQVLPTPTRSPRCRNGGLTTETL